MIALLCFFHGRAVCLYALNPVIGLRVALKNETATIGLVTGEDVLCYKEKCSWKGQQRSTMKNAAWAGRRFSKRKGKNVGGNNE